MNEQAAAEQTATSNPPLAVQAVLRTDVGLVRSENQDFGAFTSPQEERESHPGGRLLIVADGMGGHRGGATASRLATETVKAQYLESETVDVGEALRAALTRANARIFSEAQGNPDLRGMGTTASALVLKNSQAWFAHIGDSRIYRVRGGVIEQLTEDHSLVASMVREGLLTPKEAETHPRRNVLQRSMGVGEEVEIDVRGPFDVMEGDLFILCSDGLHGLVKLEELGEIAALPIQKAADEYVRRTLERGAPDNVTVIVAKVIRADEMGDETLTDSGRETIGEVGRLEETDRHTAAITPLFSSPAVAVKPPLPPPEAPVTMNPPVAVDTPSPGGPSSIDQKASAPAGDSRPISPPLPEAKAASSNEARKPSRPAPAQEKQPAMSIKPQQSTGGGWKWILIALVVAAGAAGAWMFWSQQQAANPRPSSAPRAR
ncbi:MAG: Stp1/IreP family PP2C-type Ser/Thr phosphatase [Thermoanaerobaculia bacterium]